MADGRLWEEREARALNSDELLCISQVTVGRVSIHHKRSLSRPLWRLALHGAAEFLWHFVTVRGNTETKCHISNVQRQYPRWGAIARQSMVVLLTLRAECSLLARKPASSTPYLPGNPQSRHTGIQENEGG